MHSQFFILVLIFGSLYSGISLILDHGSSCTTNTECQNRSYLLYCNSESETCDCVNEPDVKYDEELKLCSVGIEGICFRPSSINPSAEPRKRLVPCIKHAACTRPNKTCHCNRYSYPSQDKMTCLPRKDYGNSCSVDVECNHLRYFSCVDGTCGCDSSNGFEYHQKLNTCFIPIGDNCTKINIFENPLFSGRYDSCPLNADCYKGKCVCRPTYKESLDGNCGRDYGESCGLDCPCSDLHFVCHSGKCVCKYPKHQVYNKETGTCDSIVPGPCTNGEMSLEAGPVPISCIPNAQCIQSQCRCTGRYKLNRDGHCVKPFGHDCLTDSECANNVKTKLACINNQCQCPDLLQEYDREVEKCLGKLGFRCSLDLNSTEANHCAHDLYCKEFGPENEYGLIGECVVKEEESISSTKEREMKTITQDEAAGLSPEESTEHGLSNQPDGASERLTTLEQNTEETTASASTIEEDELDIDDF